ncbi:MAG: hypothetical protein IRZ18_08525, partial [Clostridia bacterium]|nr:hypothetical protein [Clostridia bacterium]
MIPGLLLPGRPFVPAPVPHADDLIADLGLDVVFDAMGAGDAFARGVARDVILTPLATADEIRHRQAVFDDFRRHPELLYELDRVAQAAIEGERRSYFGLFARSAESLCHRSREVLAVFADAFDALRAIAETRAEDVDSPGLRDLFATVRRDLAPPYLEQVRALLPVLEFRAGRPPPRPPRPPPPRAA